MPNQQPIGACAILLNTHNQVLLGKRKNSYQAGMFGLPGGRIELNEPIEAAINREVEEETGLALNNLAYVGVIRANQGEYDFIHFVFAARVSDQQPSLCEPDKCEGWEWLDPTQLDDSVLPGHKAAIEMYLNQKQITDITQ